MSVCCTIGQCVHDLLKHDLEARRIREDIVRLRRTPQQGRSKGHIEGKSRNGLKVEKATSSQFHICRGVFSVNLYLNRELGEFILDFQSWGIHVPVCIYSNSGG